MRTFTILSGVALAASLALAGAATTFNGGNLNQAASWSNGLPAPGNDGTIAVSGSNGTTVFNFGSGSVVHQNAGTITSADGFNLTGGTWNLSGGRTVTRYFISNGSGTVINLSGGTVELSDVSGTQYIGVVNNGTMNISGSAVLDGTQASAAVQTTGTLNFASDWIGSWTWGPYAGSAWRDLLTGSSGVRLDGAGITGAVFDASFVVTNGGKTLALNVDPTVARYPLPQSGASEVAVTTNLAWTAPGGYTPSGYDLYFGTDPDVRANPKTGVTSPGFDPPGPLEYDTTYYWVVDSQDGATSHPGGTWTFVTGPDPTALYDPLRDLALHNVVWNSPSANSAGSMPIGNGDIGMNVWAQPDGDLLMLLSKTDAWDDSGRLLKLGRIRLHLDPNPFAAGLPFVQTLNLPNGEILISAGAPGDVVTLRVWADANHPAIHIDAAGANLRNWQADVEIWRTTQRTLSGGEEESAYGYRWGPNPPVVLPDTVVTGLTDRVTWYHRNTRSPFPETLSVQALSQLAATMTDPILNRTFGATLNADGFSNTSPTRLVSDTPRRDARFTIVPLTKITATPGDWLAALEAEAAAVEAIPYAQRYAAHISWWHEFWNRHWLVVTDPGAGVTPGGGAYAVTQGYLLQRFVNACGGRGNMPIKFNGSIFTYTAADYSSSVPYDADYRRWGPCYWWQNTRLPYWTMPVAGDLDLMEPLFRMYLDALPLARERCQTYHGHPGAYFPEVIYFWGTWNNDNYGWNRSGKADGTSDNMAVRWEWQGGIELLWMMLARYAAAPDDAFAINTLVPFAQDIIDLYDYRFPRDPDGQLRITPAQALETYREGSENPMPEVAGLRQVLAALLALPESLTTTAQRSQWQRLLGEMPPLPLRTLNGATALSPAEVIGPKANSESPELYPVFPYAVYHVGKPDLALADWTYQTRVNKTTNGWSQDVIFAAMVGRAAEAKGEVIRRFQTKHSGSRFPTMWGPNYDWLPDQDHGGVTMTALQKMLIQEDGDRILLLPAWPADWNLRFRVHARNRTVVDGRVEGGQLTDLNVSPPGRYADVETFLGTVPPQPTGWDAWRRNTPGAGGNPADNGDGDPFPDLLEYALGGDPADPATPQGLTLTRDDPGGALRLSYTRPTGLGDVIYQIEWSDRLDSADWPPLTALPAVADHGDGTETLSWLLSAPLARDAFYRLRVALSSFEP
jgi:hypothetical protein